MIATKFHIRPCRHQCIVRCSSAPECSVQQQSCSRRPIFAALPGLVLVLGGHNASANVVDDLERQLPSAPATGQQVELPKSYQRTMHKLVKALQTSIEAEAAGAKEFEVRRKADGAKELVREFVKIWQDNAAVRDDVTHDEMRDALSELGRFYQKKGPRSRLDESTKQSVLGHLAAVEAALPPEEKSILGL